MIGQLRLEAKQSVAGRDQHGGEFLRVDFSEEELAVSVGGSGAVDQVLVETITDHTVYELESFSMGLLVVAGGRLPRRYKVKAREELMGPHMSLWPALRFRLGGYSSYATVIFASMISGHAQRPEKVELHALNEFGVAHAFFEIAEILAFAEDVYAAAKQLAPDYVHWGADFGTSREDVNDEQGGA